MRGSCDAGCIDAALIGEAARLPCLWVSGKQYFDALMARETDQRLLRILGRCGGGV